MLFCAFSTLSGAKILLFFDSRNKKPAKSIFVVICGGFITTYVKRSFEP